MLTAHPAVAEAWVVGAPDAELGQVVWAFVALRPETEASEAALKVWAGERIAAYKVPERIVFMAALPKGVTGKVGPRGPARARGDRAGAGESLSWRSDGQSRRQTEFEPAIDS